jgi:hypothetical protein
MWRGVLATIAVCVAVYLYGHPVFDGYRPAALDRPLHGFHADVNQVARIGTQDVNQFVRSGARQQAKKFVDKVTSEFSGTTR